MGFAEPEFASKSREKSIFKKYLRPPGGLWRGRPRALPSQNRHEPLEKGNLCKFFTFSFLTCTKMPLKIDKNS
jgi:hypothetical protein